MNTLSESLIEMAYERDPARWAAMQIIKCGRPNMTCGEAADMIERIVRDAIAMSRVDRGSQPKPGLLEMLAAERDKPKGCSRACVTRTMKAVRRFGWTVALLSDYTDNEILSACNVGAKTLAVLRRFAPRIAT